MYMPGIRIYMPRFPDNPWLGGLPQNDVSYFRGQSKIGVIRPGTLIKIIETPIGINRGFAVQYWAKEVVLY